MFVFNLDAKVQIFFFTPYYIYLILFFLTNRRSVGAAVACFYVGTHLLAAGIKPMASGKAERVHPPVCGNTSAIAWKRDNSIACRNANLIVGEQSYCCVL